MLLGCCTCVAAQLCVVSPAAASGQGVALVDLASVHDGGTVVARQPGQNLSFSSAAFTDNSGREVIVAYLNMATRRIGLAHNSNGAAWQPLPDPGWTVEPLSLSLFNIGRTASIREERRVVGKNNLLLFAGGRPLQVANSYAQGNNWSAFTRVNGLGSYRITGIVRLKDQRLMALTHDDGRFISGDPQRAELRKSAIYKMYSSDGGLTWSAPELALRHNLNGLYDAAIVRVPYYRNSLVMICADRQNGCSFISVSRDEGATWSYPSELPPHLTGDRFSLLVDGNRLRIVYRDMLGIEEGKDALSRNPFFGDLVMWTGDLKKLIEWHHGEMAATPQAVVPETESGIGGIKFRIADNYPVEGADPIDRRTYDCGYPTIFSPRPGIFTVVACGYWESDPGTAAYIKSFVVEERQFKQAQKAMR